jgi:homoserine kinase
MSAPARRYAAVRVPATTANLGAGFDCLGMAVDKWLNVSVELRAEGQAVTLRRGGTLRRLDRAGLSGLHEDLICQGFYAVVNRFAGSDGFGGSLHFEASSDIPIGRGLGSSAAALVAGAALANAIFGLLLSVDDLAQICARIEGHGDNVGAAAYGGAVLVSPRASGGSYYVPVPVHESLGFAFAVPEFETRTELARAALPATVPFTTAVNAAARSASLVRGLQTADRELLAAGLDDVLHVPHRKALVEHYERVAQAARSAGAFGATLSGSGSSVVAIAPRALAPQVATAMAGAWCTGGVGARGFATGVCHDGMKLRTTNSRPQTTEHRLQTTGEAQCQ